MADPHKLPQLPPVMLEQKSPQFRELYSNFSRLGVSPWDIQMVFGNMVDGQANTANIETSIRMSPQQFKAFVHSLPLILKVWEQAFGEITVKEKFLLSGEVMQESLKAAGLV